MKRLTIREPNGNWNVSGYEVKDAPTPLYMALFKLKDYEDTGLNPDDVQRLIDDIEDIKPCDICKYGKKQNECEARGGQGCKFKWRGLKDV